MSPHEQDPWFSEDIEELASDLEIQGVERLARGLVGVVPGEHYRRYQISGPTALIEFSTAEFDADDSPGSVSVIAIAHRDDDGPRLQIAFGYDNAVTNVWGTQDEQQAAEISGLAQELLEDPVLDEQERMLVNFIECVALLLAADLPDEQIEKAFEKANEHQPVGDAIRELMMRKTRSVTTERKLVKPLDDGNQISISELAIDGDDEIMEMVSASEITLLSVELVESEKDMNHHISWLSSGHVVSETYNPLFAELQELEEEDAQNEAGEEDDEVEASHESYRPTRKCLDRISTALVDLVYPPVKVPDDVSSLMD